jgi:protein-L-isoaspartate(D-aspartate) O-methyltransferase
MELGPARRKGRSMLGRFGRETSTALRERMVAQIVDRGLDNRHLVAALLGVERERFLPPYVLAGAYDDAELNIGEGQMATSPHTLARMIAELEIGPHDRVLEIGTGSGYGTAILSFLAHSVYTVELEPTLAARAAHRLRKAGRENVRVRCADGREGWPEHASYRAILVCGACPTIPEALIAQLTVGGHLVFALGDKPEEQQLVRVVRTADSYCIDRIGSKVKLASLRAQRDDLV